MAEKTDFHSLNPQISKDVHGSDNSMPLSPQWLLPKPGENKAANATVDNHVGQYQGHVAHADVKKTSLNGDEAHEALKKKNVFRPTVFEVGYGRGDRWRDEERDTNTPGRKDRWRETDKELVDPRKVDRWGDNNNPSAKQHYGESRRNPPERWTDSTNKETNYEHRRESKWNTSWGPGDKDTDNSNEKSSDSGIDKGLSHHIDDKKDLDHNQPWRSSSVHGRGTITPSKQGPNFSYGRGRGDNSFSHGRGRVGSIGTTVNREEDHPSLVRYSRNRLLDVYRMTDMNSRPKLLDGGVPIASLTQEEPIGPLALCTPTSDELAILKGIGNGDIVSSGEPQISKDGSTGRNSNDPVQARQVKFGSREDSTIPSDDNKGDMIDSSNASREVSGDSYGRGVSNNRPMAMWRSPSIGERSNPVLNDRVEKPTDIRPQTLRDPSNEWTRGSADSSHSREQPKWQVNDGSNMRRQTSFVLDMEHEARRQPQISPEDLKFYYKDPQGAIQGPFAGSDIIGWFEAGYFGIDLLVRVANAPPDSPFLLLGDAMPHLRAKARPPPGFASPKPNEATDTQGSLNLSGYEKLHASSNAMDIMKNEQRYRPGEAENRFLESLMSGNPNASPHEKFAFHEGIQGMNFERQKSLPNSYPYRPPGRDASLLPHNSDLNPDTINPHTMPLSSITDTSRSQPLSQNMLSTLQGLQDRAPPSFNNTGVSGWPNLPVQSGLDHAQNFPSQAPFGFQQQRMLPQNQPSLTSLLPPNIDIPSALVNAENLLSSGLTQDQQMLNLLLLQQLHSQSPVAPQQISLLDKLMLLKQQQKQEEQQQLLRQQQQLLSQILSDRRVNQQHYNEQQPYGELQSNLQIGSHIPVTNMEVQPPPNNVAIGSSLSQNINHSVGSGSSTHLPHQIFEQTVPEKNWDSALPTPSVADVVNVSYELPPENFYNIHEPAIAAISDEKSVGGLKSVSDNKDEAVKELVEETQVTKVQQNYADDSSVNELKTAEARKTSEKKSRKQKSSKVQQSSSDQTKGISKATLQQSKSLDNGAVSSISADNNAQETTVKAMDPKYVKDPLSENLEAKGEPSLFESDVPTIVQQQSVTRAWRPAPGFRPKSLLEIQEEEQRNAQMAIETMDSSASATAATSHGFSTPWAGLLANSDIKTDGVSTDFPDLGISENKKGRKSQLHDLLSGGEAPHNNNTRPTTVIQSDLVDDGEFIEAKDTKKGRKKSAKAKNGAKASVPIASADVSIGDRTKTTRQTELEKEVLPAVPSGPSLGDFVLWKGGESASTTVAPAWSTDTGKASKPTSLRDILREQEKKGSSAHHQIPIPTPQKALPTQVNLGSNPSWSASATSSAKAASPIPMVARSPAKSKLKGDDDLFWGPLDQPKQETKNMDFPMLASQDSFGTKNVPGKGGVSAVGSLSRQKSASKRPSDSRLSSPPSFSPSLKGKTDAMSKHSEAMGFKDWCERESTRLLGSKDTSFLEFCSKQSKSEAKVFLVENLGAIDRNHEFIDRFINYMELLPSDVLEMAFQSQNNSKKAAGGGFSGVEMKSGNATIVDSDNGGTTTAGGGGGKKKGKKGKKVSASVLGFNVVSNRIMMGEIQNVED
ncbi:protein ESSENTIAL FOR POTEXVIRUS ACCUMULATION 1-like [Impatiens glandulifera]|uniref:protein ESSENTIAL FOR POTEXVIRUS ACCUMULATION 1-like n=1 Tax=Impatiens glandulifera TaxID=253017 RepID=UPI001FB0D9B7|nr:protein ESSENTIAL FOR POTEXVIRUS ACCUMULATION 1-like [Impatiens glandulifera]